MKTLTNLDVKTARLMAPVIEAMPFSSMMSEISGLPQDVTIRGLIEYMRSETTSEILRPALLEIMERHRDEGEFSRTSGADLGAPSDFLEVWNLFADGNGDLTEDDKSILITPLEAMVESEVVWAANNSKRAFGNTNVQDIHLDAHVNFSTFSRRIGAAEGRLQNSIESGTSETWYSRFVETLQDGSELRIRLDGWAPKMEERPAGRKSWKDVDADYEKVSADKSEEPEFS
jgi:hypothetical protein